MSVIEDAEARQALRQVAREYHKELVADRGMDFEAKVLEIIRELQESPYADTLSIKEITERFAERHGADFERKVTPHWIGNITPSISTLFLSRTAKPTRSRLLTGTMSGTTGSLSRKTSTSSMSGFRGMFATG